MSPSSVPENGKEKGCNRMHEDLQKIEKKIKETEKRINDFEHILQNILRAFKDELYGMSELGYISPECVEAAFKSGHLFEDDKGAIHVDGGGEWREFESHIAFVLRQEMECLRMLERDCACLDDCMRLPKKAYSIDELKKTISALEKAISTIHEEFDSIGIVERDVWKLPDAFRMMWETFRSFATKFVSNRFPGGIYEPSSSLRSIISDSERVICEEAEARTVVKDLYECAEMMRECGNEFRWTMENIMTALT